MTEALMGDPVCLGGLYVDNFVYPYLEDTPDDWTLYRQCVGYPKKGKHWLPDEDHTEIKGICEEMSLKRSQGGTISIEDLDIWNDAIRNLKLIEARVRQRYPEVRFISYMAWTNVKGEKSPCVPKSLFPDGFSKRDKGLKVKIMQFSCWDYWTGGAPEEWRNTDPNYSRTGFNIDKEKAPFEFNAWGNPASQVIREYREKIRPYVMHTVLDQHAEYYKQPLKK